MRKREKEKNNNNCFIFFLFFRYNRKHVFGLSTTRYSGNSLFSLPFLPAAFQDSNNRNRSQGGRPASAPSSNPDFIDNSVILYSSAGLGIIHNLATTNPVCKE
jgi:hypothetical protein